MRNTLIRITKRAYATPTKGHALGGDARNDVIRRALFDAPLREVETLNEEDLERQKVIEKAWSVYLKEQQNKQQQKLNIKYQRMVEASKALKKLSPKLFEAAHKQNISLIFPKQMKIPTESPANIIWNYESITKSERLKEAAAVAKKEKKKD